VYREHWGLKELPFENVPDPRYFYPSPEHQEALMRIFYAVNNRKGAAMLTGEVGCGKTILSRTLIQDLSGDRYEVGLVANPSLSPLDFLREILYQLGVESNSSSKLDLLHALNDLVVKNLNAAKDTVILIDEAQAIEDEATLEELRLLLNFQLNERFLLTLILVGQPELREKVGRIRQLDQRIAIKYHLGPLSPEETRKYILYRLEKAGAQKEILSPEGFSLIHRNTHGIPRDINNLCDMCLLLGFGSGAHELDLQTIQKASMAVMPA
jgi:general secretion pathway protein A